MPIGSVPSALVVSPSKGFKDLKDFVAKAKAAPGGFTYASAGVGSTTHLTAERFRISAGFPAVHVPFRGGGFQPEMIAGRVDIAYSPIATSLPNIKEGRLQALAVSSPQRASALPTCRPRWRQVTPIPITLSGSGCSSRPRRRERSSTSSTWRPARRSQRRSLRGSAGRARCHTDADVACGFRCVDQERNCSQRRAGQGWGRTVSRIK